MATYRALNLSVTPTKPSFADDEDVHMLIECDFERKSAGGFDGVGLWAGDIYLNSISSANLLDSIEFARGFWTPLDTGHYSRDQNFGKKKTPAFTGAIVVAAHDIW